MANTQTQHRFASPSELNQIVSQSDTVEQLHELLLYLNSQLQAAHVFIANLNENKSVASVVAHIADNQVATCFDYDLKGTPCENVANNSVCALASGVVSQFPDDQLLVDMGIVGYLGVPLETEAGETVGILVSLYKESVSEIENHRFLFETFSRYIVAIIKNKIQALKLTKQNNLLEEVGSIAKAGGWELDIQTGDLYWSEEVYRIYGLSMEQQVSKVQAISHYPAEALSRLESYLERLLDLGEEYRLELPFIAADGKHKWVRTTGKPEFDSQGKVIRAFGAFEDITKERASLLKEVEDKNYLRAIMNSLSDAVITINANGEIRHTNTAADAMFGYAKHEWANKAVSSLMPEPYASKHSKYMSDFMVTGNTKIIGVGRQLPAKRKNGDIFQMELNLSEAKVAGEKVFIGVVRDISEKIKAKETIYKLAYNDKNTGLPNRSWFEKEVSDLLVRAKLQNHFICCGLVDIDKMATWNLKLGKDTANSVIKTVANQLSSSFGGICKIYQAGADSFYVVSLETFSTQDRANVFLKKMDDSPLKDCMVRLDDMDTKEDVTFSTGIITISAKEQSLESIIDLLEYAKSEAKKLAPAGITYVDDEEHQKHMRYRAIKDGLKDCIDNDELQVYVQPQYSSDKSYYSGEALLRWHSPTLGFVSPGEFIPIAEETGDIIDIGYWVLMEVCRHIKALNESAHTDATLAVNISGRHLGQTDFEEQLFSIIESWGLSPSAIKLELTETVLVEDIDYVKAKMNRLRDRGIRFSIDDFGTGYSSLSYLQSMPISELKIDRAFVGTIDAEEIKGREIVDLIIQMAKSLNVKTVAEGVETEEQLNYLKTKGCNLYQGFLLAKPMPIDDWKKEASKSRR